MGWTQKAPPASFFFLSLLSSFPRRGRLSRLDSSQCVLNPGSRSWTEGSSLSRGWRPGPPSPGPTRGDWTPAGLGLLSQSGVRRRRWRLEGSSSSRPTERGTQTTPTSPAGWRTKMIPAVLRCDVFKRGKRRLLPVQQKV